MKKWISNGAESSLANQLIRINEILNKEILLSEIVEPQIYNYEKEDMDDDFDYIKQELILNGLRDFSYLGIHGMIDVAKMLIYIDLEMRINKLGYYNLSEDVFKAIERLGTNEKLIIISDYINKTKFKGTKEFEYLEEFKKFRNSYAHGKVGTITYKEFDCDDIKTQKNVKNTISKEKYELLFDLNLINQIEVFVVNCGKYIKLINYLNKINQFEKNIYDNREKEIIERFLGYINKQCKIIKEEIELDDEIRGHLQMILDKMYIDIITAKKREEI